MNFTSFFNVVIFIIGVMFLVLNYKTLPSTFYCNFAFWKLLNTAWDSTFIHLPVFIFVFFMCKPFVRYMVEVRAGQCVLGWEEYDLGLPRIETATALGE